MTRAEAFQLLADRAGQGSEQALACLRQALDDSPEVWQQVGDLARHAELKWIDHVASGDHLLIESVKRQLAHMKAELAGPNPTPMERLLVDQIAVNWLAVQYAEMHAASPANDSLGQAAMRLKQTESAVKRYLSSVKLLTTLRALVPQGLAPVNRLQLYSGEQPPGSVDSARGPSRSTGSGV